MKRKTFIQSLLAIPAALVAATGQDRLIEEANIRQYACTADEVIECKEGIGIAYSIPLDGVDDFEISDGIVTKITFK